MSADRIIIYVHAKLRVDAFTGVSVKVDGKRHFY